MANRIVSKPCALSEELFSKAGWGSALWLIVRVYLGYQWLMAGWGKWYPAEGHSAWTKDVLLGFWQKAVQIPTPPARPAISYDWYRSFLQMLIDTDSASWMAPLIAYSEVLVGLALILGAFVGAAAFFGALMNMNFMLAGSAGVNPVYFLLAVLLMTAWKTAGWWGLDRWLLTQLKLVNVEEK
ncbi:DoxX family protein [Candidatus Giovannonibacteria bacterium]|nr:DoxX family protein [Candidatus Giovannonibacteria bacterium]